MARTFQIAGGVAVAALMGVAAGLALTPGPADAGYGISDRPVISNQAAKGDKLVVTERAPQKAVEVANVRSVGPDFILTDARGKVVYRSNRAEQTTTISKNTEAPLITGYGVATGRAPVDRIDAAFNQVQK